VKEIYDVVIIGGGPNGISLAAYLAKCGVSVCILEARSECGGGCENVEPIPGYMLDPHATILYGGAAPAFEQLELHKFGLRMVHFRNEFGGVFLNGDGFTYGHYDKEASLKSIASLSERDAQMMQILLDTLYDNPKNATKLLRSIYWTPPPPEHVRLRSEELPWAKVLNEILPGFYSDEWNKMSTDDLSDLLWESEALKVMTDYGSWLSGPHFSWKGTAVAGLGAQLLMFYGAGSPRGGMHSYAHSIIRCALYHGARIYTGAKVEEIIIEDGEAKGVILADDAAPKNKKIYAKKAVVSNTHVLPTFLELIPSKELEPDFIERVKGTNIKGGSIFVLHLIVKELPIYKGNAAEKFSNGQYPAGVLFPCDSREPLYEMERLIHGENTHPIKPEDMVMIPGVFDIFDKTHGTSVDGHHVISPIYLMVPAPEDHVDGPLAVNNAKDEIVDAMLTRFRQVAPNMTEDNIVHKFVNTPYDSKMRNMGFVGGNWMGTSYEEEQWYQQRPLPELSRYRTPIRNLYLCNHSSYPGGLCLQAVSYNLMHILIEDLDLKPGKWWYPSEHFIPSDA
jgi:phytoene dehydrogenase-like protein